MGTPGHTQNSLPSGSAMASGSAQSITMSTFGLAMAMGSLPVDLLGEDLLAQPHALVADEDVGPGDELGDDVVGLPAERAPHRPVAELAVAPPPEHRPSLRGEHDHRTEVASR